MNSNILRFKTIEEPFVAVEEFLIKFGVHLDFVIISSMTMITKKNFVQKVECLFMHVRQVREQAREVTTDDELYDVFFLEPDKQNVNEHPLI